MYKFEENMK